MASSSPPNKRRRPGRGRDVGDEDTSLAPSAAPPAAADVATACQQRTPPGSVGPMEPVKCAVDPAQQVKVRRKDDNMEGEVEVELASDLYVLWADGTSGYIQRDACSIVTMDPAKSGRTQPAAACPACGASECWRRRPRAPTQLTQLASTAALTALPAEGAFLRALLCGARVGQGHLSEINNTQLKNRKSTAKRNNKT